MVVNLRQPDLLVVVKKDEGEAALRSDQGVEINRHDAPFIRKYNTVDNKVATELEKFKNVRDRTEYGTGTEGYNKRQRYLAWGKSSFDSTINKATAND